MDANEYQAQAARTLIENASIPFYNGQELRLVWNAIGLAGEAGEVAELIKKAVFHEHGLDQAALVKELGDVCWYVTALCSVLGIDFSTVLEANIAKLRARYPEGWDTERSRNRSEAAA